MYIYLISTPNPFKNVQGEEINKTFTSKNLSRRGAEDKFYSWIAEKFNGYCPDVISVRIIVT